MDLFCRLPGSHQITNAATAVAAGEVLRQKGWPVTEEAVRRGLATVHWPGRLEVVPTTPLIILDGAHNPDGMTQLVRARREILPPCRCVALVGMLKDKDFSSMIQLLAPVVDEVVVTVPPSPRAAPAAVLAGEFRRLGVTAVVEEDPASALIRAQQLAGQEGMVLVCGSLYLVGPVREALNLP